MTSYGNVIVAFISWLVYNRPNLINAALLEEIQKHDISDNIGKEAKKVIKDWVGNYKSAAPYDMEQVTPNLYVAWVTTKRKTRKKPNGEIIQDLLGPSTYNTHRAAYVYMYKRYMGTIPDVRANELTNLFKGLKRANAEAIRDGDAIKSNGRDPLDFTGYNELMSYWIKEGTTQSVVAHLFAVVSWNLMCRAVSTEHMCWDHMSWENDALVILFHHSKTDQTAEKQALPRRIYANPVEPRICPILSLAIFVSCFSYDSSTPKVFIGKDQKDRFDDALQRAIRIVPSDCFNNKDIGTHSFRKGGSTYAANTQNQLTSNAISIRADWKTGTMHDRYIKHNVNGDA